MTRKSAAMVFRNLCKLGFAVFLCGQLALAQQPVGLAINVVQGNGAVHFVNEKPAQVPVVKVVDSSGQALAGARVTFQAPDAGPSATFKGALTYAGVSGRDGTVRAAGFIPNGEPGQFMLNVLAEYDGQTAQQQVTQNNVKPPHQASHRKTALKVAIAAAAVAGFSIILYDQFIAKNKPYGQR